MLPILLNISQIMLIQCITFTKSSNGNAYSMHILASNGNSIYYFLKKFNPCLDDIRQFGDNVIIYTLYFYTGQLSFGEIVLIGLIRPLFRTIFCQFLVS